MKLIIFDIDGTIIDSVNTDDDCFIETFYNLHQIDLTNVDWTNFKNITDIGLTIEIFQKYYNRLPSTKEIELIKNHFFELLNNRKEEFTEIKDSLSFINYISKIPDFQIGFATGGWKETAELKCNYVGLDLDEFIFKSSNYHFNRAKIIERVIDEALTKNNINQFETIFYFGDGIWDLKATEELDIEFIGVDFKKNNKLKKAGVKRIIENYETQSKIMNWII
ncbi:HAD family hydrolase [Algibacter aquimarinus]|uniref:phosphoglycolate phosphatase n=1 Tax=Algibacter aquimarinus TaxID=1136748 RepID=A0ABP9H0Y4_9FLAO